VSRGAVLDELRRIDWMSRSLRVKAKKLTDVISAFEQKVGRPATEAEIAEELGDQQRRIFRSAR
jgi:RNA polymerase sigma factor for flagellar operon FliA